MRLVDAVDRDLHRFDHCRECLAWLALVFGDAVADKCVEGRDRDVFLFGFLGEADLSVRRYGGSLGEPVQQCDDILDSSPRAVIRRERNNDMIGRNHGELSKDREARITVDDENGWTITALYGEGARQIPNPEQNLLPSVRRYGQLRGLSNCLRLNL